MKSEDLLQSGEIEFEFFRSSGPGGQKVNKVSTAVRLRFDPANSRFLPERVRARLMHIAENRLTKEGVLIIEAQRFRTQEKNREDALRRLMELISQSWQEPKERHETRPTAVSKEKRLQDKRHRGKQKKERKKPAEIDE